MIDMKKRECTHRKSKFTFAFDIRQAGDYGHIGSINEFRKAVFTWFEVGYPEVTETPRRFL